MKLTQFAATAALLIGSATFAVAQTTAPPKSKVEPGAPTQAAPQPSDSGAGATPGAPAKSKTEPGAPTQAMPDTGVGSRPIGPPTDATKPAPAPNPTGESKEKRMNDANDPRSGGKKQ